MSRTLALIFETSTAAGSVALSGPSGEVQQHGFGSDRNHNATLFGPLERLLATAPCHSIGLVLVGSGPGSYSGTRVGIAAAQGVAIALACPAVAVPSILAVPAAQDGAPCLAIGDARRGSFWTAGVEGFQVSAEPALCDAKQLEAQVAAAVAAGVAVFCFEDPGRFPLCAELAARLRLETPDATRLWRAWLAASEADRRAWSADIPQPLYLRPPHITPAKPLDWARLMPDVNFPRRGPGLEIE